LIGVAWWAAMYPGLFGEDSLMNLTEARDGPVSVWFTAWWIYVIRFVTFGTRAIPLLTLFGVLALTFAVRYWAAACLAGRAPRDRSRICLVCTSPLVGALGIQVRHDIEMTAGLLLCAAVARPAGDLAWPRIVDVVVLTFAVALIATRHNGVAVVLGAAIGCVLLPAEGTFRQALLLCHRGRRRAGRNIRGDAPRRAYGDRRSDGRGRMGRHRHLVPAEQGQRSRVGRLSGAI
jgi:hypothetical protein